MYDIIGDIHGHCDKLIALLLQMGYSKKGEAYQHPDGRRVIFVGDYIDRGPAIPDTLHLVKAMVEEQQAIALMGNHEYNAILFNALNKEKGGYLRSHKIKNIVQHYETLVQFKGKDKTYRAYIEWFMTLPLFYENEDFRVVHASWDERDISYLKERLGGNLLIPEILPEAVVRGSPAFHHINNTLKGKEMALPAATSFFDKDGFERHNLRIRWWENPQNLTWKEYAVLPFDGLPDALVDCDEAAYPKTAKPVFFGHYWLRGLPQLMAPNACCVDYSVAKGDKLVAYRWDGNPKLSVQNFVWVV